MKKRPRAEDADNTPNKKPCLESDSIPLDRGILISNDIAFAEFAEQLKSSEEVVLGFAYGASSTSFRTNVCHMSF